VFLQSGGAADCNRAADPDELPGFCVEHFFILEVEDLFPDFHGLLLCGGKKKATGRLPVRCVLKRRFFDEAKAPEASYGGVVPNGHKQRYAAQGILKDNTGIAEKRRFML
jgi:hypothetical protein